MGSGPGDEAEMMRVQASLEPGPVNVLLILGSANLGSFQGPLPRFSIRQPETT